VKRSSSKVLLKQSAPQAKYSLSEALLKWSGLTALRSTMFEEDLEESKPPVFASN
jgi:hypothetical protein